jgi:Arc/MetJ-type ribon-helix-helix transcriptional regulator
MSSAAKVKVSVTLSRDVLEAVDRAVDADKRASRSSVIDAWLRLATRGALEAKLRDEVIAYYDSLTSSEREEDDAIANASSLAAQRRRHDEG